MRCAPIDGRSAPSYRSRRPMPAPVPSTVVRRVFRVRGTVQGVGFRPFVFRAATELGLRGAVWNEPDGVVVDVEGDLPALDELARRLRAAPPLQAVIERIDLESA